MKKKPILFLIFKILGFVGIVIFVIGIINLVHGFGNFEDNSFVIGMFMMPFGLFFGSTGIVVGFRPEITKHTIKTAKYLQEENKEEFKKIISTVAEINSEAVTVTAQAVKTGLKEMMHCKYCGQKIDVDSQFCKYCGQKL
jgi:hypothetical protein